MFRNHVIEGIYKQETGSLSSPFSILSTWLTCVRRAEDWHNLNIHRESQCSSIQSPQNLQDFFEDCQWTLWFSAPFWKLRRGLFHLHLFWTSNMDMHNRFLKTHLICWLVRVGVRKGARIGCIDTCSSVNLLAWSMYIKYYYMIYFYSETKIYQEEECLRRSSGYSSLFIHLLLAMPKPFSAHMFGTKQFNVSTL